MLRRPFGAGNEKPDEAMLSPSGYNLDVTYNVGEPCGRKLN